ncbi:MAG: tyrosinase family protein [Oxalobacteraceae bacterium]|nr:tyrosinase family protein [Oxalobacteraceae bacterium]
MKRRTALLSGAAALASGSLLSQSNGGNGRERKDIGKLSPKELELLAAAVGSMQARPASEPGSWQYLAATHQRMPFNSRKEFLDAMSSPADKAWAAEVAKYIDFDALGKVGQDVQQKYWDGCIHRGRRGAGGVAFKFGHFLSWHRSFLWNFESHLLAAASQVAAQVGVTATLTGLPYWNYYAQPTLPRIFRQPTLAGGKKNPLYVAYRNPNRNSQSAPVGVGEPSRRAFELKDFMSEQFLVRPGVAVRGFDAGIEALPHDVVHGDIGGLMGSVPTAAWDPIFWLHHANIDRLWTIWSEGKPIPKDFDSNWKAEAFVFDGPGGAVLQHAGDTYDKPLAQKYDSLELGAKPESAPPLTVPAIALTMSATGDQGPAALSSAAGASLTNAGGAVRLKLGTADAQKKFNAIALDQPALPTSPKQVFVVLREPTVTAEGRRHGFVYQVYVRAPSAGSPVLVGSVNLFNMSPYGQQPDIRIDITDAVKGLGRATQVSISEIEVLFAQDAPVSPTGARDKLPPSGSLVRFRSIHVEAN